MKLHLPTSLRKALLAVLASTTFFSAADAACLHAAVSPTTYTDFGQNMARYSVYQVNELLTSIIARDGGVQIPYTTGEEPGTLNHKMISFESVNGDGAFTAVGYNYTATVAHNGCPNPCFTARYVGNDQAIQYQGVEYRSSTDKVFLLSPSIDYKITRSSKIYTDITASGVFDTSEFLREGGDVTTLVHYRAGAGTCDQADFEGKTHNLAGGYSYITGGVVQTLGFSYQGTSESYPQAFDYNHPEAGPYDSRHVIDDPYTISIRGIQDYGPGGAGQPTPDNPKVYLLPFVSRGGDSGSPVWAWDENDEEYKLISCHQARGGDNSYSRGASEWTMGTMEYFNKNVDMDAAGNTVHMHGAVYNAELSKHIEDPTNKVETTTQYGFITGGAGFDAVYFCGVGADLETDETVYTWLSLYGKKDVQNWYNYNNTYFNANGNGSGKQMHLGDLFNTENIVFTSKGQTENNIILDEDIDLGIGYAQFSPAEGAGEGKAVFNLKSSGKVDDGQGGERDFMLNSAGFIVDKGAELHIQVTNTQKDADGNYYYREWRKQGEGDMFLEGTGNNEIFLNLGGKGTTYLKETNGYAAYNVLINNGATVNFGGNISQIARDVTFGNGGGYLEFSGLESFTWESGENTHVSEAGFTINALTQDATLVNSLGSTSLNYVTGGDTTFLGSFQDREGASLKVVYSGGGTWTLNSIHTKLTSEGSGLEVRNGTVELVGTQTVHAIGSIGGKGGTRYSHPDDWHYADSTIKKVEVAADATFRLGSHARLTGDVEVKAGGTLEIAEGVKHRYEYIEGWLVAEDTYDPFYRAFYGLKGDVHLEAGATMSFNYSAGTDARNVYERNISGEGNVVMTLGGSGASLVLSGNSTFTGEKRLSGGGLIAATEQALGNTSSSKWHVSEDAYIAVKGVDGDRALTHVDTDSTGVLALTQSQTNAVNLLNGHENMFIGALEGEVIQYGSEVQEQGGRPVFTEDVLDSIDYDGSKKWLLGGGGGELVVNFRLDDPNAELVLGNEYTTGTVTLTNGWNQIGSIAFAGRVTLNYTSEAALGGSTVSLDYTNRVTGSRNLVGMLFKESSGAMLVDTMPDEDIDLSQHRTLYIGSNGDATYNGVITPGGNTYRFGAMTGTLTLTQGLKDGDAPRSLVVDAQTYTGGSLALAAKAGITGDVIVMGHDENRPGFTGGEVALRLDVEDAIAAAGSVTLKEGGILDVNGHDQHLNKFNMEAGSVLTDSSADWSGEVTLNVAAGETSRLMGAVEVNSLVKNGEGTLFLGGNNAYGTLYINEGLVQLENGNSMSASGITMVGENGVLDLIGGFNVTGTIAFDGGVAKVVGQTINGSLMVGQDAEGHGNSGTVQQEGTGLSTRINASVEVAEGSTLHLKGDNGAYVLSALNINDSGGTIAFEGSRLTLNRGGSDPMTVGGTISIKGNSESGANRPTLFSDGGSDNMTRDINELKIEGNVAIQEASWNTIWNIHSLTGEGDLLWNSNTTHWYSARMVFDGENSFEGKFTAERTYGNVSNRSYQAFVEAQNDLAMQKMDVSIIGKAAQSNMALAVNTDNLQMKSLSGNQYSLLYAGAALAGADHDKDAPLENEPSSTRRSTITITGGEDHIFQGNVTGQDHYVETMTKEDGSTVVVADVTNAGISLVMNGSGTQTFSGSSTRFNDITVNSGHLVLSSANAVIKENITLSTGAELVMEHSAWSLDAEHLLTVNGNASEGSAKFTSAVTMNGGTINYSGLSLSTEHAALDFNSVTAGANAITIDFSDTSAIQANQRYFLADGDWSNVKITADSGNLGYMTATFARENNGLYVNFSLANGSHVWDGTDAAHEWTSSQFGSTAATLDSNSTAVFTDSARNNEVLLANTLTVKALVFDSVEDYTAAAKSGTSAKVTATSLLQVGSGTTTVSGDVIIGTAQNKGSISVENGELILQAAATTANVSSISGGGTLGVAYNGASDSALFHGDDMVGTLHLLDNVSYTADSEAIGYLGLRMENGSQFNLTSGKMLYGIIETAEGSTVSINLDNNNLSAWSVELGGQLNLHGHSYNGKTSTIAAAINGEGYTVNASGDFSISNSGFNANLNLEDHATVTLKSGAYDRIGDIRLGASSTLTIASGAAVTSYSDIYMGEGSKINLENGNGGNNTLVADITMEGDTAEIDGSYNGNGTNVQGYITGQGTLTLGTYGNHTNSWRLDSEISESEGRPLALVINSNVTLTGNNSYSGGTSISGGTVQVSNLNAFGSGGVTLNNGTLKLISNLNTAFLGGDAGSVQFNGKTLLLTSGADHTYSGTFNGSGSVFKQGAGTQVFSNAANLVDVGVDGGTLRMAGGSISGQLSVAQNANFEVTGSNLTISSEVQNAGHITFSNGNPLVTLNPAGHFDVHSDGYRDIYGSTESGNGFAQGTTIKVFNNAHGAKLDGLSRVSYLGDTFELDCASGIATAGASSSVYSVRKDTVTYDSSFAAHPEAARIQVFSLASESADDLATLQLDQGLGDSARILSAGFGGTVLISKDVTLAQAQLDAQARTTLIGSGIYTLNQDSLALPSNVVLGDKESWTGVVRVSNFAVNGADFSKLANANSWVEVCGMKSGYLAQWNGGNLTTNLILTDNPSMGYAMFMDNGSSAATHPVMTVSGNWKGEGTLRNGNASKTLNLDLKFTGDISKWSGQYVQMGSSSNLIFAATGPMEVGASFSKSGGQYDIIVETDTTFNATIEDAHSFTVKTGKTATLAGKGNQMGSIAIENGATLTNTGYTTLNSAVSNNGAIINSGTLDYGDSSGIAHVTNQAGGNIIINDVLTTGHIDNSGTITISSLMQGEKGTYMDANGKTGQDNPDGNGFATTSFQVLDPTGVITNNGGTIMYCGKDVTAEVMNDGWVRTAANYGAYNIKTTDNSVSFSKIYDRSGGALEYISFAEGTSLNVDDAASGTVHLCTSQISAFAGATLNVQNAATLVVDASTLATVEATSGSTISLQLAADAPDTRMTFGGFTPNGAIVNVTGSGVLDLRDGQFTIATLNISGGTVYSNYGGSAGFSGAQKTVNIRGGGTLQLAHQDNIGWEGNATAAINLEGSEDAPAVLELGNRQTFSTALALKGHSVVRQLPGSPSTGMLDPYHGNRAINVSGTDNLLAVPIRMRDTLSITVENGGELTFDGGVYEQASYGNALTKAGAGKMILAGSGHQYTKSEFKLSAGSLDIQTDASFSKMTSSGALDIVSGTITITTYTGNSGSSLSVERGASLTFNGATTLAAPITNNGSLNFAAGSSVTLNGIFDHGNGAYLDLDTGLSSENGNGLWSGAYVVVSSGSGSYTVDGTVAVAYGDQTYTLREDGKAYLNMNTAVYYVRKGVVNYSDAVAAETSITRIALSDGATLNLQTGLSAQVVQGDGIQADGGIVNIGEGVLLSRDSLHATRATTLVGTGTYALDVARGTTRGEYVSFGSDWAGRIRLHGSANSSLNLDNVARQGDNYVPLELAGVTASLEGETIHSDLQLDELMGGAPALTVQNAAAFTFSGTISGNGSIVNTASGNSTYNFSGKDMSAWNGSFINSQSSGTTTVNFANLPGSGETGTSVIAANIANQGEGTLNVSIDNTASPVSMTGTLAGINKLTYKSRTSNHGAKLDIENLQVAVGGTELAIDLNSYSTDVSVGNLSGSGDLTLTNESKDSSALARFILEGGDYSGSKIAYKAVTSSSSGGARSAMLVIADSTVAQTAVIETSYDTGNDTSHTFKIGIGINDANVRVAGVNDGSLTTQNSHVQYAIVSGDSFTPDGTVRTLEITGNDNYSTSAKVGGNINLVMSGSGSQTFAGNMDEFNGGIIVEDGSLILDLSNTGNKMNIKTLELAGDLTISGDGKTASIGQARVDSDSTARMTVGSGTTLALNATIQNYGDFTIADNSNIDVSNMALEGVLRGYTDTAGTETKDGSGFALTVNGVRLVRNIGSGELHKGAVTVRHNGEIGELDDEGWVRLKSGESVERTTYYVRDASTFSAIRDASIGTGDEPQLTNLVFDKEGTVALTLDGEFGLDSISVAGGSEADVNIAAVGKLTRSADSQGVNGTMVLSGSGTYELRNAATLGRNVSLDTSGWNGTVLLTGAVGSLNMGEDGGLWISGSKVQFDGLRGSLAQQGWTSAANIELVSGDAMIVEGGVESAGYALSGALSGSGNIVHSGEGAFNLILGADTSKWSGGFRNESGVTNLTLAHSAVMHGAIANTAGAELNVVVDKSAIFAGGIKASSLAMGDDSTFVLFQGNSSIEQMRMMNNVTVDSGASLQLCSIEMLGGILDNKGNLSFVAAADGSAPSIFVPDISGLEIEKAGYYQTVGGVTSANGNGFYHSEQRRLIVNSGTISGYENVVVRDMSFDTYNLLENGCVSDLAAANVYYVHQDTVAYSSLVGHEEMKGICVDDTLVPGSTPVFELDRNLAATMTEGIVSKGGTIRLGANATLQHSQLDAQGATTLQGLGTYDIVGAEQMSFTNISLGGDWAGTVRITDANGLSPFNLSKYANSHSSLELNALSGWWDLGALNFSGKLVLDKDEANPGKSAFKLTDASSNKNYQLSGGVSGAGDYVIAYDAGKRISATTHTISGDVSNWTGAFIDSVAQTATNNTTTLSFTNNTASTSDGVVYIGASILDRSTGADHKLNVNVTGTNGSVHMTGLVEGIDQLTYDAAGANRTLILDNLVTNENNTTIVIGPNNAGGVVINNLSGTGELILNNTARHSNLVSFDLAGGDCNSDAITFRAMTTDQHTGERSVLLSISDADIAARSVIFADISVRPTCGNNASIGIGINDDVVRIGGLQDVGEATASTAKFKYSVVSGKPAGSVSNGFSSDNAVRTLEIVGSGGESAAGIGSNLNLVMNSAEGAQSFSGDMSAFSGDIDVQAGTLDLASSSSLKLHSVTVAAEAALELGAATTTYLMETIANNGSLTLSGAFVLDEMNISGSSKFVEGQNADNNGFLVGGPSIQVVQGSGVTSLAEGTTMTYHNEQGSFNAQTGVFSITGHQGTAYETFYVNADGTAESLAHATEASDGELATIRLSDGTTLNVDLAGGALNSVEVASSATAKLNVSQNATISRITKLEKGDTLTIDGNSSATLTLGQDSTVQGNLLITHSTVKMGNVQSLGAYNRITSIDSPLLRTITVGEQGVLDVNGGETNANVGYTVTLDGGTLTNSGAGKNYGKRQPVTNLILESNSKVSAENAFGLVASGHDTTTLVLNGHTMEKTGGNTFYMVNTTVLSGDGGRIKVSEGMLNFNASADAGKRGAAEGSIELAGGNVAGHIKLGGNAAFEGTADNSIVTADIDTNGHEIRFAGSGNIAVQAHANTAENGSGAVSGSGTIVKEGSGNTALSGSLSNFRGSVEVREGILNMFNQARVDLNNLTLVAQSTLGVYGNSVQDKLNEVTLQVAGTLTAQGEDSRLNADLVLDAGATLAMFGTGNGLNMGSAVTLGGVVNLGEFDMQAVNELTLGETYQLFNGVDSFVLGEEVKTEAYQVAAKNWINGLDDTYKLVYSGSVDGGYVGLLRASLPTPEPTTSTLSLLALAALAARRRRK